MSSHELEETSDSVPTSSLDIVLGLVVSRRGVALDVIERATSTCNIDTRGRRVYIETVRDPISGNSHTLTVTDTWHGKQVKIDNKPWNLFSRNRSSFRARREVGRAVSALG